MTNYKSLKPYYPHKPIGSVDALARSLGVHPKLLRDIAARVEDSYTSFNVTSNSGKERTVFEPKYELKKLQKRINARLMEQVTFPPYLTGGIRDLNKPRDYVQNAAEHAGSRTIIKLDIKNFYTNIRREYVEAIYSQFFRFSPDVAHVLTDLTTYRGRVPQGACTSSYLANLVFFNAEYHVVSALHNQGLKYTRLLDDITISSGVILSDSETTDAIKRASALCRKHELKLYNSKKKEIDSPKNPQSSYLVTGILARHRTPKIPKRERKHVRQLVYICECEYRKNPYTEEYHKLWNRVSGKVAKIHRLGYPQAKSLRKRLGSILPLYDDVGEQKIVQEVKKLTKDKQSRRSNRIGHIRRVHKVSHQVGILARTNKPLARSLRKQLKSSYARLPTVRSYWLE